MTKELQARSQLPPQVAKVLAAMPKETHPMTQLSQAVLALQVGGGGTGMHPPGSAPTPAGQDLSAWSPAHKLSCLHHAPDACCRTALHAQQAAWLAGRQFAAT